MTEWSYVAPGLAALAGALLVLAWRLRETRRPVSARSILIPPLGMSTGFSMFLMHDFRVSWAWALGAFAAGALLLAVPLMRSTTLARQGDTIVMQRSRVFLGILLGLVAVRLLLRNYVAHVAPGAADSRRVFHPRLRHDRALARLDVVEYQKLMNLSSRPSVPYGVLRDR